MIDFQLFIINMLCIIGASFLVFIILSYFNFSSDKAAAGLSVFIGILIVLILYWWINIPKLSCNVCSKALRHAHRRAHRAAKDLMTVEEMSNFNNDTPKFVSEQDGLILPENAHATIRTDINLDKFLEYGYMSEQLRKAMEYQKKYGGTNPPPSYTATSQIIAPYSDVVIPVDPFLIVTTVPEMKSTYGAPEAVDPKIEEIENFSVEDAKIMLFFSPHCGFCKDFMKKGGIWEQVKKQIAGKIDIMEINNDLNPQMTREYNVAYFPCLMKVKNNNIEEFDNDRTYENVLEFCLN